MKLIKAYGRLGMNSVEEKETEDRTISAATLEIAKKFGHSEQDLLKYGFELHEGKDSDLREAIKQIAKLFGLTREDFEKYSRNPESDS
jgi:hypothetical protein